MSDPYFWTGLGLVLLFFIATRVIERSPVGEGAGTLFDKITHPLWLRLDDFIRIVIGATDMAEIQLKYGKDAQMRDLAERILKSQKVEIEEMRAWLKEHGYDADEAGKEATEKSHSHY